MTINLYISPAVKCESCENMTHYAAYESETVRGELSIEFSPRCPTHDFSESYPVPIQHRCIRRFVQAQLQEYATVSHISRCDPRETGYIKPEDDHFPDWAWLMHYKSKTRDQTIYVVYSPDSWQLYLLGIEQASL